MINFLKYRRLYAIISLIVIAAGLFSIWRWGFIYSIDFVGGSNMSYQLDKEVEVSKMREVVAAQKVDILTLEKNGKAYSIRTKAIDDKKEKAIRDDIEKKLDTKVTLLRAETVGPTLGRETMIKTLIASGLAALGILLYMAFAFKGFTYALAAIGALFHDIIVLVGTYSLVSHFFGAELDTLFVTAALTTMSFSVHDTIVVFDKIREYSRVMGKGDIEYLANKALTETMVRSINNSMTIIFMLFALVVLGGATIRFFAVALLIGTITGTYSSPFVATPILVWLEKRMQKRGK